jgi:hypothetical protein
MKLQKLVGMLLNTINIRKNKNMKKYLNTVITGSGSFVPEKIVKNSDFLDKVFYDGSGEPIDRPVEDIIEKFSAITEIVERRWVDNDMVNFLNTISGIIIVLILL